MGPEEFLRWIVTQDRRHELVDGEPVMMAGANRRHDRIASTALRLVGNQLEGRDCQPFTSDIALLIPAGNIRYPDLGVDCGPFDDHAMTASEPRLVVEILSPTTRSFDLNDKLEEYKTVESLDFILLVDPDVPQARLYRLTADRGWASERLGGLDAVAAMPELGLRLRLADLYAGLEFRSRPTPVEDRKTGSKFSI
ncbi:Uma2 family endonuclease [Azospirillum sp. SYSU D00513]|uniref:Uma2 family endonuclease n=1 Tax=Azospirillum sp. SYSU D00513 TaxID=2812561 RepID=UPI001A973FD4|nr:Uma2 family endonuclease [Azospirillum sp. SYSU D00513]